MRSWPKISATTEVIECADADLVARTVAGDHAAFAQLVRRHNRLVYRVVWCVLSDGGDVEDTMQQAYLAAFRHLVQFEGRAAFATWLARIAHREALTCRSRQRRARKVVEDGLEESPSPLDPERQALAREAGEAITGALAALPDRYRKVFILRVLEGMSTADTAASLEMSLQNVKVSLYRAKAMLGGEVAAKLESDRDELLRFGGERCDRVTTWVRAGIHASCFGSVKRGGTRVLLTLPWPLVRHPPDDGGGEARARCA